MWRVAQCIYKELIREHVQPRIKAQGCYNKGLKTLGVTVKQKPRAVIIDVNSCINLLWLVYQLPFHPLQAISNEPDDSQ